LGLDSNAVLKNFNIGYDDGKNHKGDRMKIQSTFMYVPYGISSFAARAGET
jgi:hypothetical protein